MPGVTDEDAPHGGRSMLDPLDEDHHLLGQLCSRLADHASGDPSPRDLTDVLAATLSRHLSAELQCLYPTVKAVLPRWSSHPGGKNQSW